MEKFKVTQQLDIITVTSPHSYATFTKFISQRPLSFNIHHYSNPVLYSSAFRCSILRVSEWCNESQVHRRRTGNILDEDVWTKKGSNKQHGVLSVLLLT